MPQQLLTVEQATERLAVSKATLYRLVRRGQLRALKIGRGTRFVVADLDAYIERQASKGLS